MSVRRVVAASREGRAVIAGDGAAPRHHDFKHIPQMSQTVVWATEPADDIAAGPVDRTAEIHSLVPGPGATRFVVMRVPPRSVTESPDFDPQAAQAERLEVQPGLAELSESDPEGKHRTTTTSYVTVVEGEVYLELDEDETKLVPGDVVVQVGTRHSWSVRTEEPATIAAVVVGMPASG